MDLMELLAQFHNTMSILKKLPLAENAIDSVHNFYGVRKFERADLNPYTANGYMLPINDERFNLYAAEINDVLNYASENRLNLFIRFSHINV